MTLLVSAPSARARAALDLRCQRLTPAEIAARFGVSEKTIVNDLQRMRRWYDTDDTVTAAYLHGRTQGTTRRRRRVRDDEPTLPWTE